MFTTDVKLAVRAQNAGINGIIVDWESRGKLSRQKSRDLEANFDTPEDVKALSSNLKIPVIVRINPFDDGTTAEVECALLNGAKMIMLPMATSLDEVKKFLEVVANRAKTIVQIETPSLVKQIGGMQQLKWNYVYIGLNDLMVARGGHSIWEAILDGTVDSICNSLKGRKYGFGGATFIGGGSPIPCTLILHELVRLNASITLMRRTFHRELLDRDLDTEMKILKEFIVCSQKRGRKSRLYDHENLVRTIKRSLNL